MTNSQLYPGMTQQQRQLAALSPTSYALEERTLVDHLVYLQRYAKRLRFHDERSVSKGQALSKNDKLYWSAFLDFTVEELAELAQLAEQPALLKSRKDLQDKYAKPHYTLVLTFIQLLKFPKAKQQQLTQEHLDYCYRTSLQMASIDAEPDLIHVVFKLAEHAEYLAVKAGTLVSAEIDDSGQPLYYALKQDLLLNHAQVTDIKAVWFDESFTTLEQVREQNDDGISGFDRILKLALGAIEQLPDFDKGRGKNRKITTAILLRQWFVELRDKAPEDMHPDKRDYLFNQLNFARISDWVYCFDVLNREVNRGLPEVGPINPGEWQRVYRILTQVHLQGQIKQRLGRIKALHLELGIEGMFAWLFGSPAPGDMLFALPQLHLPSLSTQQQQQIEAHPLAKLYFAADAASERYVQRHLCLSFSEFEQVFARVLGEVDALSWHSIYQTLERAWAKKRGFVYQSIEQKRRTAMHHITHYQGENDHEISAFMPFAQLDKEKYTDVNMGLMFSSDILMMSEGQRQVTLVLDCKPGTLPMQQMDMLQGYLQAGKPQPLFYSYLSTADGWQASETMKLEYGELIAKPALTNLAGHQLRLKVRITDHDEFTLLAERLTVGQYILLPPKYAFAVTTIDTARAELLFQPVMYAQACGHTRLLTHFEPQQRIAALVGNSHFAVQSRILSSDKETFSPEQVDHFVVDDVGQVYQIRRFIDANQVAVEHLCQLAATADVRLKQGIFVALKAHFDNSIGLDSLQLQTALLHNPNIEFSVTANRLTIRCPERVSTAQIVNRWQELTLARQLAPGRFDLSLQQDFPVVEQLLNLADEDHWQKRYESNHDYGLRVIYQGRQDDSPHLTIGPMLPQVLSEFAIIGKSLMIKPGKIGCSANILAAQWRHWCQHNANQGFQIESQDTRLFAATPMSEVSLPLLDLQDKIAEFTDADGNGISIHCVCPAGVSVAAVLQENQIDAYGFTIDDSVEGSKRLIIRYPRQQQTLAGTLIKAWQQWLAQPFNDDKGFDIRRKGQDVFDIQGQSAYHFIGVYQATASTGAKDPNNQLKFVWAADTDKRSTVVEIKQTSVNVPEFAVASDGSLQVSLPNNKTTTINNLVNAWQDWQVLHPHLALSRDLQVTGNSTAKVVAQKIDFVKIGEQGSVGDNGLEVSYRIANNLLRKERTRVIVQEQALEQPSDHYGFSYRSEQDTDTGVLTIHYPNRQTERTIERLLADWQNHSEREAWGFELAQSGKGSWQVEGETELTLTDSRRRYYQLKTSSLPYLQLNYEAKDSGVPYLTMEAIDSEHFTIDIIATGGVPNLKIGYPRLAAHCRLDRLFDRWYEIDDHLGFVLSDDSQAIGPLQSAPLLATGNSIKQVRHSGMDLSYIGPDQPVSVVIEAHQPFADDPRGQQLLLDTGQVLMLQQKYNAYEAAIDADFATELRYQTGIYPAAAVKTEAIRVTATVSAEFPAIAAINQSQGDSVGSAAMKLVLNPNLVQHYGTINQQRVFLYNVFKPLVIERARVAVAVDEMNLVPARNEYGLLDSQSEFSWFGHAPDAGAYFEFSHPELCGKPLEQLTIRPQWQTYPGPVGGLALDLPDMSLHYHHYSRLGDSYIGDISNVDHTLDLQHWRNNHWQTLGQNQPLFTTQQRFSKLERQWPSQEALTTSVDQADPQQWPARFRLRLNQGFWAGDLSRLQGLQSRANSLGTQAQSDYDNALVLNQHYREMVLAAQIAAAEAEAEGKPFYPGVIPKPAELPNRRADLQQLSERKIALPYTPTLTGIRFGYQASSEISLTDAVQPISERPTTVLDLYRYHPFGIRRMGLAFDVDDYMLPLYRQQGYLCFGLSRLLPGQSVSLLFQLLTGSGDPYVEPEKSRWQYLAGENWLPVPEDHLLRDQTEQLQDSGLVQLKVPDDASLQHTLMPRQQIWFRVGFAQGLAALPQVTSLRCQAVAAEFVLNHTNQTHLAQPLAANAITDLVTAIPGIESVSQPFASFNGRAPESDSQYYQRVAAHLRHKGRGLTCQDYESLILTRFPQIYKVKCLPTRVIRQERAQRGIGNLQLEQDLTIFVVVGDSGVKRPKATKALLKVIQGFVDGIKPARVTVKVENPTFEELTYRLAVKFKLGKDKGFYSQALNKALVQFLSPWLADQATGKQPEVSFGNTVYSASVIRYIESLDYIDYVANFTVLRQIIRHSDFTEIVPLFLTKAHAVTARQQGAILVSDERHIIDVIESDLYDADAFQGIGYMMIGMDYWVERPGPEFSVGIGEMVIDERQVDQHLLANRLPELDTAQLWQQLLELEYITAKGRIGKAFNPDTGIKGLTISLPQASKQTLYTLLLERLNWQPHDTPVELI